MSLTTPISGAFGKITIGASPTTIAITDWTYKIMGNSLDLSNTTDGRRRIAGLPDAEGSFNLHVDTAAELGATVTKGLLCNVNMYTDGTKKYGPVAAIVEDIEYSNKLEESYDAKVSWKLASGATVDVPA